jgi:hypothetical protein
MLGALAIVKPEIVIKWHRAGFRSYRRWKSRRRGGRPTVAPAIRKLIREMSIANSLRGAPRIHAELLKLGIDIYAEHGGLPLRVTLRRNGSRECIAFLNV